MKNPKIIVITGASSGLGAALARHYARAGVTLHLTGRNNQRLESVAKECRSRGAAVHTRALDITDAKAVSAWLMQIAPVDLIIANAGISAGIGLSTPKRSPDSVLENSEGPIGFAQAGGGGESAEQVRNIFSTNIDGVVNTVTPLLQNMIESKHGQIAIISSLAGIRGLPSSPAYSTSKACVRVWGEGLRGWLAPYGVKVNVVCPGFIRTPMTDVNPYRMPLMMDADKAARIIARGLAKNKARIAFPLALYFPLWLLSCVSPILTDPLFARLPAKPSENNPLSPPGRGLG